MLQVDQIDISGDGNLLHFAVIKDLKEHVRMLLEHGLVLSLLILQNQTLYEINRIDSIFEIKVFLKLSPGVTPRFLWLAMMTSHLSKQQLITVDWKFGTS